MRRAVLLLVSLGCAAEPELARPDDHIQAVLRCLSAGQFEDATSLGRQSVSSFRLDPAVWLMDARLAMMEGDSERAIGRLKDIIRYESSARLPVSTRELHGTLGDLLFDVGDYGESRLHLLAAATAQGSDRPAKAAVALQLPHVRRDVELASVEMPLRDSDLPELLCSLAGKQRALVLDTGSTRTTLTQTLAKDVGVRHVVDAGLGRDSVGNSFSAWMGVLPELRLGAVDLGVLPVSVVEDHRLALRDEFGGPEHPPEGVVGLDVLQRFRMTLDPVRKSVIFEPRRRLGGKDVVQGVWSGGVLLVATIVEGATLWLIIDTGASHSSFTSEGLAKLPGGSQRVVRDSRRARTVGGTKILVRQVRNVSVRCSGVVFRDCTFSVLDRPRAADFPVHGVLGADLLRLCRITIDGNMVEFTTVATDR